MTTANGDAAATADEALEAAIDGLYRGPRARFVAERNALAKRLRSEGRTELAARVKGLSKPGISAWAVGQLWWTRSPRVRALREAGERVREALRSGAGPSEHAEASRQQRRIRDELVDAAREVLSDAGLGAGASTLRRISTSLEALAALGRNGPHPGRLSEDLDPPGFDVLGGLGGLPEPLDPSVEPVEPREPTKAERAALAEAERAAEDARARAREAARYLDEATRDAEASLLRAQAADQEHERATLAAARAREAAEAAMLAARRARAEAGRHHERLERARRRAQELTMEQHRLEEAVGAARAAATKHG